MSITLRDADQLRCRHGGKRFTDAEFRTDISKRFAGELAPLVCTKPYDALAVRNHHVEVEPADRQLDATLGAKENHSLPPRRVVVYFEHVLVSLLGFWREGPKKVAAD